jgi:Sulfotransferase family
MSWPYQALSKAFSIADRIVPKALLPGMAPETLIAAAGTDPSPAAREGLRQLVAALKADSELSFFGRVSLRWDMIRLLRNAQLIEDAHRARPALGNAPITAPIFILGLPRSGTTFLHGLMAEDPENLVPRNWQTIYPAPRPPGFNAADSKSVREVDRQLNIFGGLAPGFSDLHPITADSPQECSEITAHVFQSLRFDTTYRVPGYFTWLEAHSHLGAFAFHRQFLQYLQNGVASRWVLKCPDHTFSLDAILQTYPDARFIVVHRDPIAVLSSVAHLTEVLRKPFLRNIDAAEIGAQVTSRWTEGANLLLEFDQRADVAPERKIHLHYHELTGTPLAAIQRIYAHFGLALSPAALAAISNQIGSRPRGGYASHKPYSLERFQVSAPSLQVQFAPYVSRYCGDGD